MNPRLLLALAIIAAIGVVIVVVGFLRSRVSQPDQELSDQLAECERAGVTPSQTGAN